MKKLNRILSTKLVILCAVANAATMCATFAESPSSTPASGRNSMTQFVRVSPRDPRYLELTDGTPYIPIGLNMIHPIGNPSTDVGLAQMDQWMQALANNGGNYIRIWLSAGFWEPEQSKAGVFSEEKAKRVDAVLAIAKRHGIRVKITIEHFRDVDPKNPGHTWALKTLHHVSDGGTAKTMTDWLANDASREQFRRKLAWLQIRFGDNPTIYGWELWNEVNAVHSGDYLAWTEAMLPELKRLFPKNLALQSLGSFDSKWAFKPYERLCKMQDDDVAQVHRYLDLGASLPVCHGPVDVLAADAVRQLETWTTTKPAILAESGAVEPHHAGPSKLYAKDKAGILLHDILFAPFFAGSAGSGECWHWDVYVDRNNLWRQFRGFSTAVRGIDPAAESFEAKMIDHPRLRIYVLKGKRTWLVWCRDKENTWQTELRDGRAPEKLANIAIALKDAVPLDGRTVRTYDPWKDVWSKATLESENGSIRLPTFSRSIVVRGEAQP
jgi:hypothetical protein